MLRTNIVEMNKNMIERKQWMKHITTEKFSTICRLCGCKAGGEDGGGKCAGCGKGFIVITQSISGASTSCFCKAY